MSNLESLVIDRVVSIHAPARGATSIVASCVVRNQFQSTPLREGRLELRHRIVKRWRVSIHAPARGATVLWSDSEDTGKTFQSTPLREGRRSYTAAHAEPV